jgi:hypothetical protein
MPSVGDSNSVVGRYVVAAVEGVVDVDAQVLVHVLGKPGARHDWDGRDD